MSTSTVPPREPPIGPTRPAEVRRLSTADTFAGACVRNRRHLGRIGNEAFRTEAGVLTAESLSRVMEVTLPHWRPQQGRHPWKGRLVLVTAGGGLKLTGKYLSDFYAVEAPTKEQRKNSARSIQRMLQVVGTAYLAADGDQGMVLAMLLALLDEEGKTTPWGLLKTAKKKAPWAACLRRDNSPDARVLRLSRGFRNLVDEDVLSLADLEDHQADVARAIVWKRRRASREGVATIIDWPAERPRTGSARPERGARSVEALSSADVRARSPNSSRDENWS